MRFWVLAATAQAIALAVIAHRFLQQPNVFALSSRSSRGRTCGLLSSTEYVIVSRRVVLPEGVTPAAVKVKDSKIAAIATLHGAASQANLTAAAFLKFGLTHIQNYGDLVVSPGLIDTHVHFNEPGREHWEGFESGSKAAAAGGTTTVVLMPLNALPAITNGDLLNKSIAASAGKLWVDAGFWGGLVPQNAADTSILGGMLKEGALGFKSFMSPSGIADFGSVAETDLEAALPFLSSEGVPFYVHAELPDQQKFEGDVRRHVNWEKARPPAWEQNAISLLLTLLKKLRHPKEEFRIHIAHLSDTSSLPTIAAAKAAGFPITAETCPHYLNFVSQDIADGDTRFKCAPPIRGAKNQAQLWKGLSQGSIDSLASDHSPSPAKMKALAAGDFNAAWGGIAALQYNLPATWTGMQKRGLGLEMLAKWWSEAPAKLAGLDRQKGAIRKGFDADFVVWDPAGLADTSESALHHKHKLTPYQDQVLLGRVAATFVRGNQVFANGTLAQTACGHPLLRGTLKTSDIS